MSMIFYFYKKSHFIHLFNNNVSGFVTIHTLEFSTIFVDSCIIIKHINHFKIMSLTNFKIVRVVCRCNLNNTCSKFHINIFVCKYRNLTIHKRKKHLLSNNILVSIIIRINCNSSISQHSLRTSCCKFNVLTRFTYYLISHMPEVTCLLFMFYFCITNCCMTNWTIINNFIALVDVSLFI